ncbi:glycosyltransferase family A protein [Agromyces sp. NPDC049794]|uniref:glycosyltransferase family 2 protein n=1 Tax=unclassified Agromyces TaxID=2639701 RepID=UPI0033C23B46
MADRIELAESPTVSVVIPAHNPGVLLTEAVESAITQVPAPMEVLVVDDGSTDPLRVPDHPLVRVIRQPKAGPSAARNRGVLEARGELIAFLDADDVWYAGKLAAQLPLMRAGVGLCSCDFDLIYGNEHRPGWGGGARDYRALLAGNGIGASSVIVRRSILVDVGGFDERLSHAEDWAAWLEIARRSSLAHCPEVLIGYRRHEDNSSDDYRSMFRGAARVLWRHRRSGGLRHLRRAGQIYGSLAFDAFRASRKPSHLAWATVLWPDYVARQVVGRIREKSARG